MSRGAALALLTAAVTVAGESITCLNDHVSCLQVGTSVGTHEHALARRPPAPYTQQLHNYEDLEYSGNIRLGGQKIRAVYDSGSFELLVLSKRCNATCCQNNKYYYDPDSSSTYHKGHWTKDHRFGSGSLITQRASEGFSIDGASGEGFEVPVQGFWEVLSADMAILKDGTFGAIVGLGNPKTPIQDARLAIEDDRILEADYPDQNYPPWLKKQKNDHHSLMVNSKIALPPVGSLGITKFSVCFLRQPGSPGYITWNDLDPKTLGGTLFQSIPVTDRNSWSAPLTNVELNFGSDTGTSGMEGRQTKQVDCHAGPCTALLDTGTSLFSAPSSVVQELQKQLDDLGAGNCAQLHRMPNLEFNFNGVLLRFPPTSYIGEAIGEVPDHLKQHFRHLDDLPESTSNQCKLMMIAMPSTISCDKRVGGDCDEHQKHTWILGMPFFREYFTTFDLGDDETFAGEDFRRMIHVAPADAECNHPSKNQVKFRLDRDISMKPRQFDLSKVRVPPWLAKPSVVSL